MVRFNERDELHRSSDTQQQPVDNSNNLTLTGICQVNDRNCRGTGAPAGNDNYNMYGETGGTRADAGPGGAGNPGRDNYNDYGETGNPRANAGGSDRGGGRPVDRGEHHVDYGSAERSEVTLHKGDTFWKLAAEKYNGHYPIEAIYEANGLHPSVKNSNGKVELTDPTYYAGKTYVLPAASEIPDLIAKYHQKVAELGGYGQERVGAANEATPVKLIYGDTFWTLAQSKYGQTDSPPIEAIYEANGLTPKLEDCNGHIKLKDPIYYAGQTYKLPPDSDIAALERQFYSRIGHPELCPAQYRDTRNDQNAGSAQLDTSANQYSPEVQPWGGDQGAQTQWYAQNDGQNDGNSQYMNNVPTNPWDDPNQPTG